MCGKKPERQEQSAQERRMMEESMRIAEYDQKHIMGLRQEAMNDAMDPVREAQISGMLQGQSNADAQASNYGGYAQSVYQGGSQGGGFSGGAGMSNMIQNEQQHGLQRLQGLSSAATAARDLSSNQQLGFLNNAVGNSGAYADSLMSAAGRGDNLERVEHVNKQNYSNALTSSVMSGAMQVAGAATMKGASEWGRAKNTDIGTEDLNFISRGMRNFQNRNNNQAPMPGAGLGGNQSYAPWQQPPRFQNQQPPFSY